MSEKDGLKKGSLVTAYGYGGASCLVALLGSMLLACLPVSRPRRERWTRFLIHRLCRGFVAYMRFFGLLEADFDGLSRLAERRGIIIAVNHPTYLDALLIMSQMPDVFCLMKASIQNNPLIGPTARNAGYESNANAAVLMQNCRTRLNRGEKLLIFPEGTRTVIEPVGQFKKGFALFATAAPAPVVTVLAMSPNGTFLGKNRSFFRLPESLPLRYRFTVSKEFTVDPGEGLQEFTQRVETHFRETLANSHSIHA